MTSNKNSSQAKDEKENISVDLVCGIIMPIAAFDGCEEEHWSEVRVIIEDSVRSCGFSPNLVSSSADVGIIQKRIVENLFDNPIVVCDVSGRNPNVMFELGMRLAFDKPTIIIKDDKTPYSFDTSPIEHLEYPRDLRFPKMVAFKAALAEKVRNTYERSRTDGQYTTFLKNFGTFKVAKLEKEEVSADAYVLDAVSSLHAAVLNMSLMMSSMNSSIINSRDYNGGRVMGQLPVGAAINGVRLNNPIGTLNLKLEQEKNKAD